MGLNITPTLNILGERAVELALANGGLGRLSHIALGRGQYHPAGTESALADEVARAQIETVTPQGDHVEITATVIAPVDFTVGEVGFLFEDGTPFAIWSEDPARQYPELDLVTGEQVTQGGVPQTRAGRPLASVAAGTEIPFRYTIDVGVYGPDRITVVAQPLNEAYAGLDLRLRGLEAVEFAAPEQFPGTDAEKLTTAIESGRPEVFINGTYTVDQMVAQLSKPTRLVFGPNAKILRSDFGAEIMWDIDLNGHDLEVVGGGVMNGQNKVPIIARYYNSTATLARLRMTDGPRYLNAYRRIADGQGAASGVQICGLIQPILRGIAGDLVSREAGAGIPGVAGSSGCSIFYRNVGGENLWPVNPVVEDFQFDNVTSEEAAGDPDNADCDVLKIFTGASQVNGFANDRMTVRGVRGKNFRGRLLKAQCGLAAVYDADFEIDDITPITGGGSIIDVQSAGAGFVKGVKGTIRDRGANSWFGGDGEYDGQIVALYTGADTGRTPLVIPVSDIAVVIDAPAGRGLSSIVEATSGYTRTTPTTLNVTNAHVEGEVRCLSMVGIGTAGVPQVVNLENVTATKIVDGATGIATSAGGDTSIFLARCGHFGAEVPACVVSYAPEVSPNCPVEGSMLRGIAVTPASGGERGSAPLRARTIVPNSGGNGGAINLETLPIADEETHICRAGGYFIGYGLISITTSLNSNGQIILAAGGGGSLLKESTGGSSFEIGAGVNPDVDGKINVWMELVDGQSRLHIKNRIGSSRMFTIHHQG